MNTKQLLVWGILFLIFIAICAGESLMRKSLSIRSQKIEYQHEMDDREMDLRESKYLQEACGSKAGHYLNGSVTCGDKNKRTNLL